MPDLLTPIPVLRIFDEVKAREFYVDFLEFGVDWEHRYEAELPIYLQVSRGGSVLHLSEHSGDGTPGSNVFQPMRGIHAYREMLVGKQWKTCRPELVEQPWGELEMSVSDPFGNRIRFAERMETS